MSSATNEYLTVSEAAELLRVSVSTVRRWIRAGIITAHRAGQRRLLLKRTDVNRAIRAVDPAASAGIRSADLPGVPRSDRESPRHPKTAAREVSSQAPEAAQAPATYIEGWEEPLNIMAPETWEEIREAREFRTEQLMGEYDPAFDTFDIGDLASMIVHSPDRPRRRLLTPDEQRRWFAALERAQQTSDRIQKRSGVKEFPPSEDIVAEMRAERMRQLNGEADGSGEREG